MSEEKKNVHFSTRAVEGKAATAAKHLARTTLVIFMIT